MLREILLHTSNKENEVEEEELKSKKKPRNFINSKVVTMKLPLEIFHKQRMKTDEDDIKSRVNFHFSPLNMNDTSYSDDANGRKMIRSHHRPALIEMLSERQKQLTKDINQVSNLNQNQVSRARPTGVPYVYADNRGKPNEGRFNNEMSATTPITTSSSVTKTTNNRIYYTRFSRRPLLRTTSPSTTRTTSTLSTSSISVTATETTSTKSSLQLYNQGWMNSFNFNMHIECIWYLLFSAVNQRRFPFLNWQNQDGPIINSNRVGLQRPNIFSTKNRDRVVPQNLNKNEVISENSDKKSIEDTNLDKVYTKNITIENNTNPSRNVKNTYLDNKKNIDPTVTIKEHEFEKSHIHLNERKDNFSSNTENPKVKTQSLLFVNGNRRLNLQTSDSSLTSNDDVGNISFSVTNQIQSSNSLPVA